MQYSNKSKSKSKSTTLARRLDRELKTGAGRTRTPRKGGRK